MAMAMGDMPEFDFSDYCTSTTTTTTTTDGDYGFTWKNLSPVLDWEAISGSHDDFQGLIDSMMADDDAGAAVHGGYCNSASTDSVTTAEEEVAGEEIDGGDSKGLRSVSTDSIMTAEEEVAGEEIDGGDSKGIRLVHLLMAAAEALTGEDRSDELARVILVRLREIVSPVTGTNMERLAAYFAAALQGLIDGGAAAHGKNHHAPPGEYSQTDALAAFQLMQDMSPFVKFGHFTANQAILEAVIPYRRVHVVDYDIMEGIQWAPFMQALVSRKDGPPALHLRITAVSRSGVARRSIGTIQETGRRLAAFAASVGLSFSFHQCRLESDRTFRPAALKLVKGEALVFNCMLHLPHFNIQTSNSIASFLTGAKTLNPRLVTLVEEEVGHGSVGDGGFLSQFMDSLHHYSAIYDSLEAGFPMQGQARALVELVLLGPKIVGSVGRIYRAREEEEGGMWADRLGRVGFASANISFSNNCQAKLLLGLFNDGFRVEELGSNRLVLGWKSRRLLSASIWTCSSNELD